MRTLVLSALFLSSLSFAVTSDAKKLCEQVSRSNPFLGQQCAQAIKGKLFEAGVVEICSDIANDVLAIDCLKTTALRVFTSDEIKSCAVLQNDFLVIDCLRRNGANACK
jgi:hypothetical protein